MINMINMININTGTSAEVYEFGVSEFQGAFALHPKPCTENSSIPSFLLDGKSPSSPLQWAEPPSLVECCESRGHTTWGPKPQAQ